MFYNTASGGSDTAATVGGVLGALVVFLSVTVTVIVIVVILLRNHGVKVLSLGFCQIVLF